MYSRGDFGPSSIIGVFDDVNGSAITVRQSRCAMVRNRNVRCMKCADACTSGCIHLVDGVLHVDASKCVGCGTCATVCPTCALEAHNPSDAELMGDLVSALSDGKVAVMCRPCAEACGDLLDARLISEVVCLGRLDESVLVQLVAKGAREIELVCGDCGKCEQERGRACAQVVATSTMNLLALWRLPVSVKVTDKVPDRLLAEGCSAHEVADAVAGHYAPGVGNDPVNAQRGADGARRAGEDARRDARDARDLQEQRVQVLKVMKDGTLPHFVPARRERLLDGLSSFGRPSFDRIVNRLWGCVAIDPRACVSCRMCATFCPTGAIRKFDDEDGTFGIEHFPGDCVKCGSCRDICPADAITIRDSVRLSHLFDGSVHRFAMRPRAIELNSPHQILETMKRKIPGNVYER